jgi:hypothetical protein
MAAMAGGGSDTGDSDSIGVIKRDSGGVDSDAPRAGGSRPAPLAPVTGVSAGTT